MVILVIAILFLPNSDAQESIPWNLPEGAKARLGKGVIIDMQLSRGGTKLAIASSVGVRLYDVDTGAESVLLTKNTDLVGAVIFSPDRSKLAYVSGEKKCYVWNLLNNTMLTTFDTDEASFKSLKVLPDGKTLVTRTWKDTFLLWEVTTGKQTDSFSPKASKIRIKGNYWHRAIDGVVDDTGSVTYAIANHDGTVSIQDGRTHKLIRTLLPQTNEDAFLKVGQKQEPIVFKAIPPGLKNEDVQQHIPSNFRDDGKPFPIQYNLNPQNSFHATFDKQPMKWIESLKFSPDGKLLVSKSGYKIPRWNGSSGSHGPTELWDVETGEQLAALPSWVDARFSRDSKTIALLSPSGFSPGRCDIWDMVDMHQIAELTSISEVKFSGNGKTVYLRQGKSDDILVTANDNGTIHVWNTKTDSQMHTLTVGYTNKFTTLAFSDDGKTLVSGSSDSIQLWDTESGTLRNTISTGRVDIKGITLTKDNKKLTTIGFGSTIQWDVSNGKQITSDNTRINLEGTVGLTSFDDGTSIARSVYAISPNYETLAAKNRKVNGIVIWQTDNRKRIGLLIDEAFRTARGAMALKPDGSLLATNDRFGRDNEVYLWDTNTNERVATLNMYKNILEKVFAIFQNINIHGMVFDYRGETLAVAIDEKEIQLWDVIKDKRVRIIKTRHKHAICKLAFSPDDNYVASGDTGGNIQVWDSDTGKHVASYEGHKGNISVMVFTEDSRFLASTGLFDGVIVLWEVQRKY